MSIQQSHERPAADKGRNDLLVLVTSLFPDAATLEAALLTGAEGSTPSHINIDPRAMNDDDWDRLLADILAARTIVTL